MNKELIEKVIKSNDSNGCPEFGYENPLLDRNVANALARSFVEILSAPQKDSNLNNNVRHSVLANIRKICKVQPENHIEIGENFKNLLTELYLNKINDSQTNNSAHSVERSLDEFLIRRMKEVELSSNYQTSMNPEVAQALINLNETSPKLASITKDIIHWDVSNKKNLTLVKYLWGNPNLDEDCPVNYCDDIAIKMKSKIETILLTLCQFVLTDSNMLMEELFTADVIIDLVKKCSISAECFQICIRVLNHLFINTNFDESIQIFITKFVQHVKKNCVNSVSVLYPAHLNQIVVLLDIDKDVLPEYLRNKYVEQTLVHLKKLHGESENDLIMLLSHYSHWFNIYFR